MTLDETPFPDHLLNSIVKNITSLIVEWNTETINNSILIF
jgi:hypothetical protein